MLLKHFHFHFHYHKSNCIPCTNWQQYLYLNSQGVTDRANMWLFYLSQASGSRLLTKSDSSTILQISVFSNAADVQKFREKLVYDIAIFVLKRDVKLQLTN